MNKKTLIIIIASVLAVALVATGVIVFLKDSFNESKPTVNDDVSSVVSSETQVSEETSTEAESDVNSTVSEEKTSSAETSSVAQTSSASSKVESSKPVSKDTVITVGSVSGSVGKKVTIPVSIEGNPGIMAMLLEFGYDNTVLKYKGYTQGDFLTNYQFNDQEGTLRFLNLEDNDVSKNGVLVNLEFEILKSTSKTDVTIKIGKDSIANQKEELISAKGVNGTVTIK